MIDAVFISDIHLHPNNAFLAKRFDAFITWAIEQHVASVYILGDLVHVWAGDDALDAWSISVAKQLARCAEQGLQVYFMAGNRDFLVGQDFATRARMTLLTEPTVIELGGQRVLLVHGDRYCTADKKHQYLRRLTRNALFPKLFLKLPVRYRNRIVHAVRNKSQMDRQKTQKEMDIVVPDMLSHMHALDVHIVVHGHIHKPGHQTFSMYDGEYQQFVLSDWDDIVTILCYDKSSRFYFNQFTG